MRLLVKFLLALGLAFAALPAFADNVSVPANRTSAIGFYYSYSKDNCYSGPKPRFKVITAGAHGTVSSRWQSVTITQPGKCQGKRMYGLYIIYTPAKGFRGEDKVTIGMSGPRYLGGADSGLFRSISYTIDVR